MLENPATLLAIAVIILQGLALVAWAVLALRRTHYTPGQGPIMLYSVVMSRVVWRTNRTGRFTLEPGQGAVIVANHISGIDPSVIALASSRPVHWMVAKEYCTDPKLAWFFNTLGCIPVGRSGVDTAATRSAIRYASSGELVGMFPEGRINLQPHKRLLLPGRPGAAVVALKARVPVVPCYILDTPMGESVFSSLLMPARVKLVVGEPIDLSSFFDRADEPGIHGELTLLFLKKIAALAGQPDFEPKLAGRKWRTAEDEAAAAAEAGEG